MRPMPEVWNRFPLMLLAQLLTAVGFTWIYLKGKEDKPWLAQGIRYGLAIAVLDDHPGQSRALRRDAVPARARAQAGELRRRHHHPHGHRAGLDQPLQSCRTHEQWSDERQGRVADRAAEAGHRQRARAAPSTCSSSPTREDREQFFAEHRAARARHRGRPAPPSASTAPSCRAFRGSRSCRRFGVGYDHIDAAWAGAHGITVTNTPDVLTEEVADTALGLLLCTVREFPQAERYLRAGKWREKDYPLSGDPAQPHRRAGRHGPHRPGDRAPARRHAGAGGLPCAPAGAGRVRTGTIRSSSTWRATSACCWSSRRAAPRPGT